jgi:hypothetical protein
MGNNSASGVSAGVSTRPDEAIMRVARELAKRSAREDHEAENKKPNGFNIFPNTIMARETFEALPEIEGKADALFHGECGKLYRAKINGDNWHVVYWTSVEGAPRAIGSRIDIRIYRHEE